MPTRSSRRVPSSIPFANYPNAELLTSGEEVGLPAGQMGNSEVGHLNIGAGRVVYRILSHQPAIRDGSIFEKPWWKHSLSRRRTTSRFISWVWFPTAAFISHLEHLKALCDAAKKTGCRMFTSMPSPMDAIRIRRVAWVICRVAGTLPKHSSGKNRQHCRPVLRDGSRQTLGTRQEAYDLLVIGPWHARNRSAESN